MYIDFVILGASDERPNYLANGRLCHTQSHLHPTQARLDLLNGSTSFAHLLTFTMADFFVSANVFKQAFAFLLILGT